MEDRMQFRDLITSENINDDTHVIIRDYLTTKAGKWFEDHIITYNYRAVYCFQVFPAKNEIIVELAGKWNMPEYYDRDPEYVVMVRKIDDGYSFELSGNRYNDREDAKQELLDAEPDHCPELYDLYIKEV